MAENNQSNNYPRLLIKEQHLESISVSNRAIPLSLEQTHYATRVRRLKHNSAVIAIDGCGGSVHCKLEFKKKRVTLLAENNSATKHSPSSRKISIALGLGANNRFQFALQKLTELGVYGIFPLITEYSISANPKHTKESHIHRQRIIEHAFIQSEQFYMPKLYTPISIEALLSNDKNSAIYLFDRSGPQPFTVDLLLQIIKNPVLLVIGPEGGFTNQERLLFEKKDVPLISLGDTTLRFETTAIVLAGITTRLLCQ